MATLESADLSLHVDKKTERKRLDALQPRLAALRLALGGQLDGYEPGPPVCVVFEGWDASGKGGTIKRMVAPLDPRHVRVTQIAAPTADEARHHFLWRFWPALPGWGGMTIFDRSWYGRVLVERVEGFASPEQWERAYEEIVEFETTLAAEGMIICKLWLHVSPEEQLARFRHRENKPLKHWKLTDEDWRNRGRRPDYETAVEEMLGRTDHEAGPWHVIPADSKRHARIACIETVIAAIEAGMGRHGIEPPDISEDD
ncbi:MAG: polyphosphate kinase 2 family protein [Solirubrobacterales bacterium]